MKLVVDVEWPRSLKFYLRQDLKQVKLCKVLPIDSNLLNVQLSFEMPRNVETLSGSKRWTRELLISSRIFEKGFVKFRLKDQVEDWKV